VAELVLAAASSHAPMMASAREAADPRQAEDFFAALGVLREAVVDQGVTTIVMLSNEHFTNFFLESFPQVCVGVGERNRGPAEPWLGIEQGWVAGNPELGEFLTASMLADGLDPAFSHRLDMDHGIMTVYQELDPQRRTRLIPIVQNCAVPPLMPLSRSWDLGLALRRAIDGYPGDERVALIGAGGLSHWVGHPRVGDIDEEFDRWFLDRLVAGEVPSILDMPDDEIVLAGNGAHEIRSWVAVAAAASVGRPAGASAPATVLAYEPIAPWITGMGVVNFP
jgi:Catalytic LigB subunit of aromatic ring-opening dioxygenase